MSVSLASGTVKISSLKGTPHHKTRPYYKHRESCKLEPNILPNDAGLQQRCLNMQPHTARAAAQNNPCYNAPMHRLETRFVGPSGATTLALK